MTQQQIPTLVAVATELDSLIARVDKLRGKESGTALEATEIVGLSDLVLSARDDLSSALDMVDMEVGGVVRRSTERTEER